MGTGTGRPAVSAAMRAGATAGVLATHAALLHGEVRGVADRIDVIETHHASARSVGMNPSGSEGTPLTRGPQLGKLTTRSAATEPAGAGASSPNEHQQAPRGWPS